MMNTDALKPDEVQCQWCGNIFVSPEAYEAHQPRPNMCWPRFPNGLEKNQKTQRWFFPGKDPAHKPRKTTAMAAFERILKGLTEAEKMRSIEVPKSYSLSDITKVQKALEKARDS